MKNNRKGFAYIVLIGMLVILVGVVSYVSFARKSSNLVVPSAPVASYVGGEKPYIQITFDYTVADKFNIYRSAEQSGNYQRAISDFPASAHTAVDYDFPKDAATLYYRITTIDKNGKESIPSAIASVNIHIPQSLPSVSSQADIADWKTYTNTHFGFEIKYPSNWFQDLKGNNLFLSSSDFNQNGDGPTLFISYDTDEQFIKDCPIITFAGVSAYNCVTSQDSLYSGKQVIFLKNNNIPFIVHDDINNEVSHKILSTFKFTK